VHFFQPPPEQRVGGLDAALQSLSGALQQTGIGVDYDFSADGVAHFHGLWQPQFRSIAHECLRQNVPFVVSPHGMLEPWAWRHKWWKKWPYFYAIEKRWVSRAACILATAPSEAECLRRFFPHSRVEWLPLGMTGDARPDYAGARVRLGWSQHERVLLFLSRLHQKKGLDLLLRALAQLGAGAATRLVVVGDGDAAYVSQVRALAESLHPKLPKTEFVGAVWGDARWDYFRGADLFCLPSHSENFGLAVLEACQVGTPALTTNTTPWGTLLGQERAFICKPDVTSIRNSLADFFRQGPWPSAKRGTLSKWTHENFAWPVLAERYAALYRSLALKH
jgi:glycosyltransferase involved in cell wall biosynthesis